MKIRFLTAGESHGSTLMVILEGMPSGLSLNSEIIDAELIRRQHGFGSGARMKIERDRAEIVAGVMEGMTTGAPIAIVIRNKDHKRWRGVAIAPFVIPRPGHADLTGVIKYGYKDIRPVLERASARETAARVAMGAICKHFLAQFNIIVGGYVIAIGNVQANVENIPYEKRLEIAEENDIRCPDVKALKAMEASISQTQENKDTLGGIIEVIALGLPPGLGSHVHWDRRLDAQLGAAVLSIQAIKGIEIGPAFEMTQMPGTRAQDEIYLDGKKLVRKTNRSGGLEGGITTGQPLLIRAAMKPIATTLTPQRSVNLSTGSEVNTQYERSDFCPLPRAVPIVEAMVSFVLVDALLDKVGGDSLGEIKPHFEALRRSILEDISIDDTNHIYWPGDVAGINEEEEL